MSMVKPLEALLRPPVEWMTTVSTLLLSMAWINHPSLFLLSKNMALFLAMGLTLFGMVRFKQGYRVYRYQRQLKKMPTYTMTSKELPVSNKRLFLGKGFLWTPKHTQRLRDLDLSYNLHYRYPSPLINWARKKEVQWENTYLLKSIAKTFRIDHWLNPVRPYPEIGGEPCIHGVSDNESNVNVGLIDRSGHVIVIGTTGAGKTRFAELLIGQDIRRGDVVIVMDPKGDADLLKRMVIEAQEAGRVDDLLIFHLGFPEFSCRYNPIGYFTKLTQVATRVTNGLPSTGDAAAFKDFAWKYVNLVAKALVALGVKPTYRLIHFYITKLDHLFVRYAEYYFPQHDDHFEKTIEAYILKNTRTDKEKEGEAKQPTRQQAIIAYTKSYIDDLNKVALNSISNDLITDLFAACRLDKTYYDKITASVGPLLEKLTSDKAADLLSPDYADTNDKRPIFEWLQVIRHKKIVYIGMDAMTDTVVSSAVGNAILTDLVSVAGHLYKYNVNHGFEGLNQPINSPYSPPRISLHSDEFNEIIGDEFIPILNKARGAGFNVTAYTQTWSDVEARLGSQAKAGQVAGNFNTLIMFRTKEFKTVDMLLNQLPMVPILRVIPASSSADTPYGEDEVYYRSTNEDRFAHNEQRLIEQTDVLNLPKGQAFCLTQGGKLYKLRVPLPRADDITLPLSQQALIQKMLERQQNVDQPIPLTKKIN